MASSKVRFETACKTLLFGKIWAADSFLLLMKHRMMPHLSTLNAKMTCVSIGADFGHAALSATRSGEGWVTCLCNRYVIYVLPAFGRIGFAVKADFRRL